MTPSLSESALLIGSRDQITKSKPALLVTDCVPLLIVDWNEPKAYGMSVSFTVRSANRSSAVLPKFSTQSQLPLAVNLAM